MSLILEALKKLDRDKQVPDRGFLIVGSSARPSRAEDRSAVARGLLWGFLAASGLAAGVWLVRSAAVRPAETPAIPLAPPARASLAASAPSPARKLSAAPPPRATVAAAPLPEARPVALAPAPVESAPFPAAATPPQAAPPTTAPETFVLQAITRKDGQPVAVLNDRLVREGDSFGNVRVLRIGEAEVEIEVNGKRRIVRF